MSTEELEQLQKQRYDDDDDEYDDDEYDEDEYDDEDEERPRMRMIIRRSGGEEGCKS